MKQNMKYGDYKTAYYDCKTENDYDKDAKTITVNIPDDYKRKLKAESIMLERQGYKMICNIQAETLDEENDKYLKAAINTAKRQGFADIKIASSTFNKYFNNKYSVAVYAK